MTYIHVCTCSTHRLRLQKIRECDKENLDDIYSRDSMKRRNRSRLKYQRKSERCALLYGTSVIARQPQFLDSRLEEIARGGNLNNCDISRRNRTRHQSILRKSLKKMSIRLNFSTPLDYSSGSIGNSRKHSLFEKIEMKTFDQKRPSPETQASLVNAADRRTSTRTTRASGPSLFDVAHTLAIQKEFAEEILKKKTALEERKKMALKVRLLEYLQTFILEL